ncbi:hypothetical protein B0T10DRAFT_471789 [Thelonectria olida]|uniref:Sodium/calcium exchanger membrane region domain-containing protein n=1 Tax=Thelonectria olida TaxID=1576542 RepID=A0A9P9AUQ4_9HYPO|nr:hypothetical protein B0T10DRAFT_471789 [Thelonectria olida]
MNPVTDSFRNIEAEHGSPDSSASSDEGDHPDEESSAAFLPSDGHRTHRLEPRGMNNGGFKDKIAKALRVSLFMRDQLHRRIWSSVHDVETQALSSDFDLGDHRGSYPGFEAPLGFTGHVKAMIFSSWMNSLLVFVPIGLATYMLRLNPLLIFTCNALAIIPLSALLTDATERIASDAGDTIGALLNITLGNLVELIIFIALVNNHIRIVQASILGSILVNLLLILGSALLASSFTNVECHTDSSESQLLAGLLFVSLFVMLMPTAFDYTFDPPHQISDAALTMSRVSSLIVLLIYILYFAHEMRSQSSKDKPIPMQALNADGSHFPSHARGQEQHPRMIRFADVPNPSVATERETEPMEELPFDSGRRRSADISTRPGSSHQVFRARRNSRTYSLGSNRGHSRESSLGGVAAIGRTTLPTIQDLSPRLDQATLHVQPRKSKAGDRAASVFILILTSVIMSMCAEFLVSTIDDVTHEGGLSESVIGLIILPVVGNIAEYVTVVTVAARNKLDLAVAVAVGSAIQIALCVTPLTVIAGWLLQRKLELTFNYFETTTLVGTVLLVILLVLNEGGISLKTIGLKGALMCACYGIIGLGAYLSPPIKE